MRDRVFAAKDKADIFNKLSRTKQKDDNWLFDTNKDLFLFALAVGWKHQLRIPLNKRDTEIPLSVFQKSTDNIDFIDLVALGETKDVHILDWENDEKVEKKLTIAEEYANGGLEILRNKLFNNKTDLRDNLLQFINKECSNKTNDDIVEINNIVNLI
jgi:dnd system-associated protein 4